MLDRLTDLISRSTGAVVTTTVVAVAAAVGLGISMHSADRFFDVREWARAIGDCLQQL